MHVLATEHWEQLRTSDPSTSRINWTLNCILLYFKGGGLEKERLKAKYEVNWYLLLS